MASDEIVVCFLCQAEQLLEAQNRLRAAEDQSLRCCEQVKADAHQEVERIRCV